MKIFGTIFPFIETAENSYKIGRHVANHEFLHALLKYGHFDSYHLFCPSTANLKLLKNKLETMGLDDTTNNRISLFLYKDLIPALQQNEYHVFHLGGWGYFLAGLAYLRTKYAKNIWPITSVIHSLNAHDVVYHAYKVMFAPIQHFDSIICTSRSGKIVMENIFAHVKEKFNGAKEEYQGRLDNIPLGISNKFFQLPDRLEARKALNIPENQVVLLVLGRLSPSIKMDLFPFLHIFRNKILNSCDFPVSLILAGSGTRSDIDLLNNIIKELELQEICQIKPNFENQTKHLLLAASDISISVTDNLQETFGISIIESLGTGLPAVVSDFNGYKDLIDHGRDGFLIPTLWGDKYPMSGLGELMEMHIEQLLIAQSVSVDMFYLAERIKELVNNTELRKKMGTSGQIKVKQRYEWSKIIREYELLWDTLHDSSSTHTQTPVPLDSPYTLPFFSIFNHYPTDILKMETEFQITEFGKTAIKTGYLPKMYSDLDSVLNRDVLFNILASLEKGSKNALSIKEILSSHLNPDLVNDQLQMSILWLAKYSLISRMNK
ncbi:MAG: glycosyltransferase family 4 protein [bacterium]